MKENTGVGILAGGNWIIDNVKIVDVYPKEEKLANILKESTSNGGAPYNVLKAISKMGFQFPLKGIGAIGNDERGDYILNECRELQIDSSQVMKVENSNTSYTDVMTVKGTGRRTFFHSRGANAFLDESYFNFTGSKAKIFHLGYLLLLDKLDAVGTDGLTGAAKVLSEASQCGMITSADLVSEQSERFKTVIPLALQFVDILFVNEFEAGMLTGIEICDDDGRCSIDIAYQAADAILNAGVRRWVIIHFPKGAIALNKSREKIFQPSVKMPVEKIKGSVGAGDAFAAGVLAGVHEDWTMAKSLLLGVNVAAASLMDASSSESIVSWQDCLKLGENSGFNEV
ncbi:carbohydrate kinase family protein [Daejeonella sp.]|uniref:carbohydrate kinase family protein n=1 Tax=Daejeonella sp. TaxID=2805397 RepID=UPI0027260129|nr:carbohydrate kinase family protein [Daejeonella sp.]MDO8992587.1 carbohydrate kinase family protein [Daejeonella sp.]MDP2412603.1 carbohydrate kinase family protein [Daejeonella sp.]